MCLAFYLQVFFAHGLVYRRYWKQMNKKMSEWVSEREREKERYVLEFCDGEVVLSFSCNVSSCRDFNSSSLLIKKKLMKAKQACS